MKPFVCCIITIGEFIRLIISEAILSIIGMNSISNACHNIYWFKKGALEYIYLFNKCKDIPCELSMSYIGHAHKCVYEKED